MVGKHYNFHNKCIRLFAYYRSGHINDATTSDRGHRWGLKNSNVPSRTFHPHWSRLRASQLPNKLMLLPKYEALRKRKVLIISPT